MDGDFKGDFTRDSFSKLSQFTRVLMQQGRVQLDADWNEQADILLYALRTLITDLVGPHWGTIDAKDISITVENNTPTMTITTAGPDSTDSFRIQSPQEAEDRFKTGKIRLDSQHNFVIRKGHYYTDGILCVNENDYLTYQTQQPSSNPRELRNVQYLVYLDAWERQITALEDENIREAALGNGEPDTATRAQVVWQVKVIDSSELKPDIPIEQPASGKATLQQIESWTRSLQPRLQPDNRGKLKAWGKVAADQEINACIIPPEARYQGAENQLYRVEIHKGGKVGEATFKWSRENGSVVFPILPGEGETVTLGALGREDRLSLHEGDWVEVVDDAYILQVSGGDSSDIYPDVYPLLQVVKIVDRLTGQVTLSAAPKITIDPNAVPPPLLRRWDQKTSKENAATEDGIKIEEGTAISLEDGIQIEFQAPGKKELPNLYRAGDYWLIPARTATGDVKWPQEINPKTGKPFLKGQPQAVRPNGVEHHYALLALVEVQDGKATVIADLRYVVPPLAMVMAALQR